MIMTERLIPASARRFNESTVDWTRFPLVDGFEYEIVPRFSTDINLSESGVVQGFQYSSSDLRVTFLGER